MSSATGMTTFRCPGCEHAIAPAYPPPSAPNCPSCGVKMAPGPAAAEPVRVYCPRCHAVDDAYVHDRCPKCGGPWHGFTSSTSAAQVPEAAFRGTGVLPNPGPTANNLGPGAR